MADKQAWLRHHHHDRIDLFDHQDYVLQIIAIRRKQVRWYTKQKSNRSTIFPGCGRSKVYLVDGPRDTLKSFSRPLARSNTQP